MNESSLKSKIPKLIIMDKNLVYISQLRLAIGICSVYKFQIPLFLKFDFTEKVS